MPRFTDELFQTVSPADVLSDLLKVPIEPRGETRVRCPLPWLHRRDDIHASATANGERGLYMCHGCGLRGDVVSLVVGLGHAPDVQSAIRWLREKYELPRVNRGSRAAPRESGSTSNSGATP